MLKKIIWMTIACGIFFSCNEDSTLSSEEPESSSTQNSTQKLVLIEMSGSVPNSTTTGDNMSWQEFYLLNSDSTFSKSRTRDGVTKDSQGTFRYKEIGNEAYLIFTHNSENELIGNCTQSLEESIMIISRDKLSSSWHACDGPGLVYKRVR